MATALLCIERGTPTIAAVHDALSQPGKSSANLFKLGMEVKSREATSTFGKFSGRDERYLSAYLSILMDGGLGLWADPAVRNVTAASDFRLQSLRSQLASIYIVIPPNDIEPLASWCVFSSSKRSRSSRERCRIARRARGIRS